MKFIFRPPRRDPENICQTATEFSQAPWQAGLSKGSRPSSVTQKVQNRTTVAIVKAGRHSFLMFIE